MSEALPGIDTPEAMKRDEFIRAKESICVANPALPYTSNTYSQSKTDLDKIISDVRIKYIMGVIDEADLKAECQKW